MRLCVILKKEKKKELWGGILKAQYKLRLFSALLKTLFHEHSHGVFGVLFHAISESCNTNLVARLFIKPQFCQCPLKRSCQLQLFWYLQQTACFSASAGNWASYPTYYVMVLKCTHYTTRITFNVPQNGCTVVSQLGFEPGSPVWRAGSLPIKPSGPAVCYPTESKPSCQHLRF